ncbi:MAG: two-component system response regulator [Gramella sp.]|uniref:response regulator transcription factor n=1 Tax=Leeuwenhoekiella TaxID=283735 RepID=UPI000C4A28BC|nr:MULTISPECIES: response regulator transcription factor [Leeuwenhoekiella]MAM17448.1 two-component system response regulator [Christiangramia sp.]MAO42337.1 two-component system response regulator [Leeuwenhoekiella sp.]HCW63633.1 DNA-binding response regulator [Leeuwenhoekiella sp.]|tara:strand:+ start:1765 stop:2466 length:702 start_codon:yes stop_codon:yes gene_type:complete
MNASKKKLLLIEDDPTLGYLLSEYLQMNGFEVVWAKTGALGLETLDQHFFDLAILDVSLPDMDGFRVASKIKENTAQLPFIFLTARALKVDVLKGFALGAVDYLKKPIDEEELVVRIKNLINRLPQEQEAPVQERVLQLGKYTLNKETQELSIEEYTQKLTNRELDLLVYLIQHKNELCTHKAILLKLWGANDYFNKKSLNVFVSHLRKYLQEDPSLSIENIHRKGFILKEDS